MKGYINTNTNNVSIDTDVIAQYAGIKITAEIKRVAIIINALSITIYLFSINFSMYN